MIALKLKNYIYFLITTYFPPTLAKYNYCLFIYIFSLFTDPLNDIQPDLLNDQLDNSNTQEPIFHNK